MGRIFEKRKHKMFARYAKMAKTFTRIGKEISIAVKAGGPNPARTPHVFVVQKVKEDFVIKYIGAIDDNADNASAATKHYVEDAVNSLLDGKDVDVKNTKAIGCTIKWRKA